MAIFDASYSNAIRMLETEFLGLSIASLEAPEVSVDSTSIAWWVSEFSTDFQREYLGSFTYDRDPSGNLLDVDGQVTGYRSFEWSYEINEYISDGFEIYGAALDVSLLQDRTSLEILQSILSGDDDIQGTSGADDLWGFAGDDILLGGYGRDSLNGGAGADTLRGGALDDTYFVTDASDAVDEVAGAGIDTVIASVSYSLARNVENLFLKDAAATATGNDLDNRINGNAMGNTLKGGAGADTVSGGAGNDFLYGGSGVDMLTGGAGSDRFVFRVPGDSGATPARSDRIMDFTTGFDRINLSVIDANTATASNDAFTFIGTAAFHATNAAGQVRFIYDSATGTGLLQASTDADHDAEIVIRLKGVTGLIVDDLIL